MNKLRAAGVVAGITLTAAVPFAVHTTVAGGSNDLKASIVDTTGAKLGSAKLSFDDGTSEGAPPGARRPSHLRSRQS